MDFAEIVIANNECVAYSDANCADPALENVTYPGMRCCILRPHALLTNGHRGILDLADYGVNDVMSSFRCTG
jgi:hypothetical protein